MTSPSNTRPGSKRRVWLWLGIAVFVAAIGYRLLASPEPPAGAPKNGAARAGAASVPVVVATARIDDVPIYLNGLGTVTASNKVTVRSRVDGQLITIAFQEGQLVHEGDLLAEIDPRLFQVQLTQAQGQLARDMAQLNSAQLTLARYRDLLSGDLIAKQQVDDQAALAAQLEGSVKTDQGLVDNAKLQLSYCRITAPISGRIGLRLVDVGNIVHINDQNGLFVILQMQPIAVLFSLPADNLPAILTKLNAGERLTVDAYDRAGQTKIATGYLLTVDNQIDQATGTTRLKSLFNNDDNALFPNQFVNARLLLEVQKAATVVPSNAIQRGPQGEFVYVVKADQSAEVRPVTVGATAGNDTTIRAGVSEGEVVVVDGVDKLRAGISVRVQAPGDPAPSTPSPKT